MLHRALKALSAELVSEYEKPQETFVSLVVNATGFQDLVDNIQDMSDAKKQSQRIITVTRTARVQAQAAAARLTALERTDATESSYAATQTNGLAGMNALLQSREAALADERAAQSAALSAAQAKGSQLQAAITTIQQREAAAKRAAETVKYTTTPRAPSSRSAPAALLAAAVAAVATVAVASAARRLGDPVSDRAVRVRRPEPAAQRRRGLGLLPDHAGHLEGVRRHGPGGLPGLEVRTGRCRHADLARRRRRQRLDLLGDHRR